MKNDNDFPEFVLKKYVTNGFEKLDHEKIGSFLQLKYRSLQDPKAKPGDAKSIQNTFIDDQRFLYR